jgi:hypothetical protein
MPGSRGVRRDSPPDVPDDQTDFAAAEARFHRELAPLCVGLGWHDRIVDPAGLLGSGIRPPCSPGTPLGEPLMACKRRVRISKFRFLGMGDVRLALRIHDDSRFDRV